MRKIYKVAFILCLLFLPYILSAQQNDSWSIFDEAKIGISKLQRKIQPKKYKTFELDVEHLRDALNIDSSANIEGADSNNLISFPDENGEHTVFQISEAPVMHPELAKKFPNNRSYKGVSVTNPARKIRFSLTAVGLSAMIIDDEKGHTFIEPLGADLRFYKVFSEKDVEGMNELICSTEIESVEIESYRKESFKNADDGYLKTYRLALSANGEYSQFHLNDQNATNWNEIDQKILVMSTLTTAVTRINAILERDLAISLQLVENNDDLIYLNPEEDPFDNNVFNPDVMLGQNQVTLDKIISPSNYDIGHVFGTTGGVAKIRSACVEGIKAQGVSGAVEPVGNSFYFDIVCHELGHQLGANHTFNGNDGICALTGQRVDFAAVEPGSGSSIMSYAGYCGTQNIQSQSDLYFHGFSLQEINNFIRGGSSVNCADQSLLSVNKNAPTAYAGEDMILPIGTAFKLNGIGNDDDGDQISYSWEQMDAGITFVPPSENSTEGALFRSRPPSSESERYFPNLKSLSNGISSSTWEVIPQVARELNFRLTIRDNNEEAGQVAYDDLKLTITDQAGPFVILSQNNKSVSWVPGTQEIVKWDVAGTTGNGINVSKVNILLSTDGGESYPFILASDVDNDGSQNITVPMIDSPQCFVMVEAAGNVFFAVNTEKFSIGEFESVCLTYESDDIPKDVIFGASNNAISLSEVEDDEIIESLSVSVKIKHSFIQDLALSLESPFGTVIELLKNPCDPNDQDIDVEFTDEGDQVFCASFSPTISGMYRALGELSQVNGESSKGQWKLSVADQAPGDDGVLESWSMTICAAKAVLNVSENDLNDFTIYPNPNEGTFTVSFTSDESGEVDISIYDLLGRKLVQNLYRETAREFKEVLSAENLTSGMYILKVRKAGKVSFRKIKLR